jgi:hypothetical protein
MSNISDCGQTIESALVAIENGLSERKVPKDYGTPRITLQDRRKGASIRNISHHHQQHLSPEQENILLDWIIDQQVCGYAPSHTRMREMATLILAISGDSKPLGKDWVNTFIKRNSRVMSLIGKPIESAHIKDTQREKIIKFYPRVA